MIVIRSFDINKPATKIDDLVQLKGPFFGLKIEGELKSKLKVTERLEVRPKVAI